MTYIAKTDWKHDDPVTEEAFNRIESGIEDAHKQLETKTEKEYVDGRVKTPVPKNAVFKDTTYTGGKNIAIDEFNEISVIGQLGLTENEVKKVKVNAAKDADTVSGHTVAKSVPADAKFTDTIVDISGKAEKSALNELSANFTGFKGNIQKIRSAEDGTLEYYDGKEWIQVKAGTEFKLGNIEGMKVEAKAGLKIEVSFGDPSDSTIVDDNGDKVTLAKRAGTMLRAKKNSYPVDEKDGQLLDDYVEKDKYKNKPYIFDNLTNGDEWFIMAFPYSENGVYTIDSANRGKATATNKLNQPAPSAPAISNLEFDRATVTGGDLVSLDKSTWHNSPHLFTGLTEETRYTAYAKKKETAEYLESPISVGKAFTTPSDLPGPSDLVGGNMDAGYFGHVPASELFTGSEIASAVGITEGTAQFNDVGWLKFASEGKVKYKSQKPFRHSISWDHINSKGAVDGSKIIEKDGVRYKVTLMKGGNGNVNDSVNGPKASEWNKVMLPMHERAKDQSWNYKDNVDIPTEDWGVGFTDADLHTHNSHGSGTYQWCREVYYDGASGRVYRGDAGVSLQDWDTSSDAGSYRGWSPVLEVVS